MTITRTLSKLSPVLLALLGGAGCSTTTPIGADLTGSAGTGAPGVPTTAAPVPPGTTPYVASADQAVQDHPATTPSDVKPDWVGYFEHWQFPSGSDAFRLHFGVDAAGNDTVSVTLGNGVVPPPPTDPIAVWPPHEGQQDSVDIPRPLEGFAYKAHAVTWQGSRLRFFVVDAEPWTSWCGLQTSYPHGEEGRETYSCNERDDIEFLGPGTCRYMADHAAPCSVSHDLMCRSRLGYCVCNATGCGVDTAYRMTFDVTFDDDHADGSTTSNYWGGYNVRLTPAAP